MNKNYKSPSFHPKWETATGTINYILAESQKISALANQAWYTTFMRDKDNGLITSQKLDTFFTNHLQEIQKLQTQASNITKKFAGISLQINDNLHHSIKTNPHFNRVEKLQTECLELLAIYQNKKYPDYIYQNYPESVDNNPNYGYKDNFLKQQKAIFKAKGEIKI